MMDEVDKLIEKEKGLGYNRQQFVESAVREKLIQLRLLRVRDSQAQASQHPAKTCQHP